MPGLLSQPDTIDGTGSQCHGDGIPLRSFSIAPMAHHPRPPASLNMALPEGRPSGRDFSHERDAAAYCHAEWPPHPYVKSRILPRQDPGTLRGGPSPSLRAVGACCHRLSKVGRRLIPYQPSTLTLESRVCVIKGQLPRALGNLRQDRQVLFDKIAPWMVLKLRCQELIARCSEAAMENGMRTMSLDQERALDIILRSYEGQVDDLELQAVTGTSLPHRSIPRCPS